MIESRRERKHPAVNPDVNDGELTGLVSAPAMAEDTVAIADAQWRAHVERVLPLASRLAAQYCCPSSLPSTRRHAAQFNV